MTSIVGYVPQAGLDGAVPIWLKFDWSEEIEHDIYRDWGTYYFNRRRENIALYYYTKALDMNNYDYVTLYRRSQVQRKAARIEQALTDARLAASKLDVMFPHNWLTNECGSIIEIGMGARGPNCPINLQICDALFELNQFENSACELHDNIRRFIGVKAKHFQTRVMVVRCACPYMYMTDIPYMSIEI